MTIRFTHLVIAAAACTGSFAYAEGTAHSLDQVPAKLDSPDARAAYLREMDGQSEADGFGTRLPAGFSKQTLIAQLAPGQDPARAVLVGAKPWAQRRNAFVAIVCIAPSIGIAKEMLQYGPSDRCEGYDFDAYGDSAKTLVWLGVYERDAAGEPRLIARTKEPVDKATDWSTTHLDLPDMLPENEQTLHPEEWRRFDLAPYLIRPDDYAFGVRAGWTIGYAGGGASFEALYLFRIDGDALRVVFAQPMMFYRDIAGDWHRNGTRDHDVTDGSDTLTVLATSTNGFRDLQLHERGGKWHQTFRWSTKDGEYVAH